MESINVEHVTKIFGLKKPSGITHLIKNINVKDQKLIALDDISFSVKKGEMIGIIGSNGSGKTTLLRTITGIYKPNSGKVIVEGMLAPLLQIGIGFQEELIAKENVMLYGLLLGLTKKQVKEKFEDILEFAELKEFENMKLKHYSSGMKTRLSFSTALQVNPDILLVDEILSVGDLNFRKKSFEAFLKFKEKNKTILYASHSIGMMPKLCDKVLWLDHGKMVALGEPDEIIKQYKEKMQK